MFLALDRQKHIYVTYLSLYIYVVYIHIPRQFSRRTATLSYGTSAALLGARP